VLYSGIDLHKRTCTITTLDARGRLIDEARMATDRVALAAYFRRHRKPHTAVVEATGSWYWIHDFLKAEGIALVLAHAKYLKAIAWAKVKTDAIDARTLAQLLRARFIPEAHMVSPELRPLRDLLRARLLLVQKRVSARTSIQRLLEKYNLPAVEDLPPLVRLHAACFQEQVHLLSRQIKGLEKSLHPHLLPNPEIQRLLWIPGIGRIGAFSLYLEIDGIDRFPDERHFFSYCRLVPGAADSGAKRRHKTSKDGNRYCKIAFAHAAVRAIQNYPEVRTFATKKARKKNKHVARAIVAKEIARIVYHVLKEHTDFNGTFKGVALARPKPLVWPRRASPRS
jgi:transposase